MRLRSWCFQPWTLGQRQWLLGQSVQVAGSSLGSICHFPKTVCHSPQGHPHTGSRGGEAAGLSSLVLMGQ